MASDYWFPLRARTHTVSATCILSLSHSHTRTVRASGNTNNEWKMRFGLGNTEGPPIARLIKLRSFLGYWIAQQFPKRSQINYSRSPTYFIFPWSSLNSRTTCSSSRFLDAPASNEWWWHVCCRWNEPKIMSKNDLHHLCNDGPIQRMPFSPLFYSIRSA